VSHLKLIHVVLTITLPESYHFNIAQVLARVLRIKKLLTTSQ